MGAYSKSAYGRARCVRGRPADRRRFEHSVVSGDRIVEDTVTGLVWQGCAAGQGGDACDSGSATAMLWMQALDHCEELDWGGSTEWRLPNAEELQSIVDYRYEDPSIDETAFPETPLIEFWSSSTRASSPSEAWYVLFERGSLVSKEKVYEYAVRCVHGEPWD